MKIREILGMGKVISVFAIMVSLTGCLRVIGVDFCGNVFMDQQNRLPLANEKVAFEFTFSPGKVTVLNGKTDDQGKACVFLKNPPLTGTPTLSALVRGVHVAPSRIERTVKPVDRDGENLWADVIADFDFSNRDGKTGKSAALTDQRAKASDAVAIKAEAKTAEAASAR